MYNEQIKLRYIKEKSEEVVLPSNYLSAQFNKVSKFEIELDKDVCNFTMYELIDYYKTLNVASLESLAVMNSHFSLYIYWCIQQNLVIDNINHAAEITLEDLKGCLNKVLLEKKILSLEQILSFVEQLPNPKDQFVLLGLFEGIKGKSFCEFVHLKTEDIYDNELKLCTGRFIKVSDKLLQYAHDSIQETMYYSSTGTQTKTMTLVDRGYIIKDYPNTNPNNSEFAKGRVIYNSVTRSLNYVGVLQTVSANSVHESGKIHMIKQRAAALNMSAKDYIYSDYIKEVEHQFGCKIVRSNFWLKYEGCFS